MSEKLRDGLRFYANPKSWTARQTSPGPYSTGPNKSPLVDDGGRRARAALRGDGCVGDFILIMCDVAGVEAGELLRRTGIEEARFQDILMDRVTISSEERRSLASAFSISPDEF